MSRSVAIIASVFLASLAGPLAAGDDQHTTYDSVVYWGLDFARANSSQDDVGFDAGAVTALNDDLEASGWILTANIGFSRSELGPSNTDSRTFSVLAGHMWQQPGYYFSLSVGGHYVNNDETPSGSVTDGSDLGVIGQYGFETKRTNALYVQSYGSLSSVYETRYVHVKVGYKTSGLKFGGEFTAYDDEGSPETLRYGAFLGDIPLGAVTMDISAGYQEDRQAGKSDGFYGSVAFSVPFDAFRR